MNIGKTPKSTPENDLIVRTEVKKKLAHAYFEKIFFKKVNESWCYMYTRTKIVTEFWS